MALEFSWATLEFCIEQRHHFFRLLWKGRRIFLPSPLKNIPSLHPKCNKEELFPSTSKTRFCFSCLTQGYVFIAFRERRGEREKHLCEREAFIGCLLYTAGPGVKATIWVCALTWNWTHDLSVTGPHSDQVSRTSQGPKLDLRACKKELDEKPQPLQICLLLANLSSDLDKLRGKSNWRPTGPVEDPRHGDTFGLVE